MSLQEISLVVATYNSVEMLRTTLAENLRTGFGAIIVVDGESTDDTEKVVDRFQWLHPGVISFYRIPRRGLANARNFGTSKVQTAMTMHAGPDNIIPREATEAMYRGLDRYDLVSCQTRRLVTRGYLGTAHSIYKKRFTPGVQTVVGTPYIGHTEMFLSFPFNEKMLNSDDTELEQRLADTGKTIYRTDALCFETGFERPSDIVERWLRWGRGDALYYRTQRMRWPLKRKIRSWLHPFKAEIVDCWSALTLPEFVYVLPFVVSVMTLRYMGWIRYEVVGRW